MANLLSKTNKRWNQSDLRYFNFYLDKAHGKGKIVLVSKDVYYKNVVLFVQYLQSLVTFKGVVFVKVNITIFFLGFALKWYTSKLNDFDHNTLNNNP